ncbi:MAG: superoxide dismutase family protein [Proteobacteria bacterium]|nr:superoxide dismutase family protein [Pseudomonadota bacterium]
MKPTATPLHLIGVLAATALLVGCAATGMSGGTGPANVRLGPASGVPQPQQGAPVQGNLVFTQEGDVVRVSGSITGLKSGAAHAFHVHEKGDCGSADFSSAGSHFNPTGARHGAHGGAAGQHHLGDMPQLMADAQGTARVSFTSSSLTLQGPNSIVGKAVIVHRDPDDVNAQPVGNAGPRLACGVIARGN